MAPHHDLVGHRGRDTAILALCLLQGKDDSALRTLDDVHMPLTLALQVVQEYERAVIFRLGRLLADGSRGPGTQRAVAAPPVNSPSASLIPLSPFAKMYYQNSSGASNDFLPRPGPDAHPAVLHHCQDIRRERFSHSSLFHFTLHSGVRISVVGGCVSAALLQTTFDHLDSDSGALTPIRIDLQAFSSCSPALRTTPKSTSELRS